MRFFLKLFAVLLVAWVGFQVSGYYQQMSRIRVMTSRPQSDHRATEEMRALESGMGWDIPVATHPATTAPTTRPDTE